ncbi:MAG: Prolyl oligopeptidase [Chthonomonadaceae bacterium]|nr:Prolyl oligopeptidase [Chthonomonadaceae bacterium]
MNAFIIRQIVLPSLLVGFATLAGQLTLRAQGLDYPQTQQIAHTDTYFGTVVSDPYRWLEDDNSAATKAWVEAENKVTFDYLAKIPYRAALLARLKQLENYPKYSAPFKKNDYVFFYKNDGLQNQSVLYMQKGLEGKPEVLIDPNTFSADGTIRLASFDVSKDGRYAVYGRTAIPGSDWVELHVIEIATHRILPDTISWVKFSGGSWRGDGFYYSRYPTPPAQAQLTNKNENQKVYFHKLGTEEAQDALVYEDTAHPSYFVSVGTTEDERFAILSINDNAKLGNALYFREESKAEKTFTSIVKEITDSSFNVVDNEGDKFLISTNHNAPNQKVVLYDPLHPEEKEWKTVLPERKDPMDSVSAVGGKLIVTSLKDVTTHPAVYDRQGKRENEIALPGPGTASGFGGEKQDTAVFYVFSAFNTPPTIYRYDIPTRKSTLFRAPEIPGFRAADYESKEVFYKSKDGTRVPMFVTYKKGLKRDGKNPTLLYGYGGFNITLNPYFNTLLIAWLEQGGVYAEANLRGGGEYGEKWHQAGARLKKQNVFDDCIAAAEWLIQQKYTSPEKLALQGSSNGGLLVGAVINQRPDLFRAAIPEVGVMDMLRFQKFTAGAAWVADYGSSDDETQFRYLLRYSPLQNITEGAKYPAVLVTTSDHDDRVVPAHSFKYAATLQAKASHDRPVLIRIETNSGHGSSNLTKALEETADVDAFLFYNLGVTPHFMP